MVPPLTFAVLVQRVANNYPTRHNYICSYTIRCLACSGITKDYNMASFDQLGLSPKALAAVKRMGFERPTPVQEQAIPLELEGHDIIAGAQTGTGKTAAFTLPAMDILEHAKGGSGPLMLVVTPTRELAQQIAEVAEQVAGGAFDMSNLGKILGAIGDFMKALESPITTLVSLFSGETPSSGGSGDGSKKQA